MAIYQVILEGYDSSTEETDDHVIWVTATNKDQVIQLMDKLKVKYAEVHETTLGDLKMRDGVDLHLDESAICPPELYTVTQLDESDMEMFVFDKLFLTRDGAKAAIEEQMQTSNPDKGVTNWFSNEDNSVTEGWLKLDTGGDLKFTITRVNTPKGVS